VRRGEREREREREREKGREGGRERERERGYLIFSMGSFSCWQSSSMCIPFSCPLQPRTLLNIRKGTKRKFSVSRLKFNSSQNSVCKTWLTIPSNAAKLNCP